MVSAVLEKDEHGLYYVTGLSGRRIQVSSDFYFVFGKDGHLIRFLCDSIIVDVVPCDCGKMNLDAVLCSP
jgi:hypothetical protein